MIAENILDKSKLISELKEIHIGLVEVYKKIFEYKYKTNETFKVFIDKEYKENSISSKEKKVWNDNFCHRASYTLLNKILFVRICEDKGFMLNPEDYIAGEAKDLHIGEKLSKIGLQKWANLITNYTLGELIKFAFLDMKKSYGNIILYKEDRYEILNPTNEELSLKYLSGDEGTRQIVSSFENVLNNIIEKLDTNTFNFKNTDGNILGDVYEKFMDRETRKAIGQFYTPEFVIEHILKNTVAEADVVENPFVSVADISCGSGHFLIMAYDILRDKFLSCLEQLRLKYTDEIYVIKKGSKVVELKGSEYWNKENIHYHILKHCIYGADIDSFAVQLTTINLLLKDLDNFTDELNIVECDSLVKWETDYDWKCLEEQLKEEFETIDINQINLLGEEERVTYKQKKESFILKYKNISGQNTNEKINNEKAEEIIELCQFWSKKFDYIVGNPPYGVDYITTEQKGYFKKNYESAVGKINTFALMFERALKKCFSVGYIIPNLILSNSSMGNLRKMILEKGTIRSIVNYGDKVFDMAEIPTCAIIVDGNKDMHSEISIINLALNEEFVIDKEIYINNENFAFTLFNAEEFEFLKSVSNNAERFDKIAVLNQGIITGNDNERITGFQNIGPSKPWKRTLRGKDINRYEIKDENLYVDYTREILACPRTEDIFDVDKKIVLRRTSDELIATIDDQRRYILHTLYSVRLKSNRIGIEYLLALLNSRLFDYIYKLYMKQDVGRAFAELRIYIVNQLPIVIPEKAIMEVVNSKVNRVLSINNFILLKEKEIEQLVQKKNILEQFGNIKIDIEDLTLEREKLLAEIDEHVMEVYKIPNRLRQKISSTVKKEFVEDALIQEYIKNKKTLKQMFEEYDIDIDTFKKYRTKYLKEFEGKYIIDYFDMSNLNRFIGRNINNYIIRYFNERMEYSNIQGVQESISISIMNFDELMHILRGDKITKKSGQVIKETINAEAYTWSTYRKVLSNKIFERSFVKYYDNDYYGLSEWSDEIHKKYFLDAIEEYTVNNPNEKKAKDIFKFFKDLDIQDKQDYIEIIEGKIKRAFH